MKKSTLREIKEAFKLQDLTNVNLTLRTVFFWIMNIPSSLLLPWLCCLWSPSDIPSLWDIVLSFAASLVMNVSVKPMSHQRDFIIGTGVYHHVKQRSWNQRLPTAQLLFPHNCHCSLQCILCFDQIKWWIPSTWRRNSMSAGFLLFTFPPLNSLGPRSVRDTE